MNVERELKLGAWGGFALPDLDGVLPGITSRTLPERTLDAVYYDTSDLRLARSGVSLRHRAGDDPPWTVKLPGGEAGPVMARREITFEGPAGGVPPAAASLVRAYARAGRLEPVARLKTRRVGVELAGEAGRVAEVVDDEVSVYHGRRLASRFREVEVELDGNAPAGLLSGVLARLRAAGAGNPEGIPKVARALGPRAAEPADVLAVVARPGATIGEVVAAAIAAGTARIIAHDPGVRMGDDPEDVHQARVGTRRLRSDLRTFRPLLDPDWVAGLREELGWLGGLLGVVRDAEVLMERLKRQGRQLHSEEAVGIKPVLARLADDRDAGRHRLVGAMDGQRYVDLLERLVAAAADPVFALEVDPGHPADEVLPRLVRRPWRRLRAAVRALPEPPADEELHNVRILAKHARYAAEASAGVMGKQAAAFAAALAAVQTTLGNHQDACVTEEWLRAQGPVAGSATEAMLVGQLIGLQRAEAASQRARWPRVWRRVARPRLRAWMG